jgi:hypothetical protein
MSFLTGILLYFFNDWLSGRVQHVRLLCFLDDVDADLHAEVDDRLRKSGLAFLDFGADLPLLLLLKLANAIGLASVSIQDTLVGWQWRRG